MTIRSIHDVLSQDGASLESALHLSRTESRIELQMLLQRALNVPRAYLLAHPEQILETGQQAAYETMLQRRLRGEPIAHILGEREFFGLNLKVTPATLIPRPETELLVELALERLPSPQHSDEATSHSTKPASGHVAGYPEGRRSKCRVLDLGTGTGAIAISIAHSRPDAEVVGVDASPAALEVACENARRLGLYNVSFLQSDWFSAVAGQRFDLIVSNPPYIAADDVHLTQGDVRFEPLSALASGVDGLDDIRRILAEARGYLEPGGWLLLEHGYDQAARVREVLLQNDYVSIFSTRDLAGIERVSGATQKITA